MIQRKNRIVLYQPKQVNVSHGRESSKDMLPLELLTISAYPLADGYEVEILDGSLYSGDEGHRKLIDMCEGAMMVGTTGILGYMVNDGYQAMSKVKAKHPDLPAVIGGWFASVRPDLMLETGLYDAVILGQGELTFRDLVRAIDAGSDLEEVSGLALWRDGAVHNTVRRAVVGWEEILPMPWHLIDIEPYRVAQLRPASVRDVIRLNSPPWIGYDKPYFGITYFGSYGCPEPCGFCCSPAVTDRRWKPVPAERMLDDLEELHDRWGFDAVRFHDANWGVSEKRARGFAEGMLNRDLKFGWNCFIETHSILQYKPDTLDMMADSGMYVHEMGAEAGEDEMMKIIGKPIHGEDNVQAAVEMDRRGIQGSITYIVGYPGESEESMMSTLDQCLRVHNAAPLSRPNAWPYRPIPGTPMWDQAVEMGYKGPTSLPEWGSIGEYHLEETWPGNIPPRVAEVRRKYQHYVTLSYGLARGRIGWWEKRAQEHLENGSYKRRAWEAKAFGLHERVRRKFTSASTLPPTWIDSGDRRTIYGSTD